MTLDLNNALAVADSLARRAGAFLLEGLDHPRRIDYKGAVDLVTEYDKQSEAMIVAGLREAFPDHHIVGEEGGGMGAPAETAPYRWVVDPLDGTTNYAHGIPYFAVSMALTGPDNAPLVGLVYDPTRDECFQAIRGQGATRNGKPMHVSAIDDLSRAALITGFPYDRWTNPDNNVEEFAACLLRAQSVSRMGSAALNLCNLAAGRFDGYWEMRMKPWDILAGLLCVTEAGGQISNTQGGMEGVYEARKVVASNGVIHEQMLTVLSQRDAAPRPAISRPVSP